MTLPEITKSFIGRHREAAALFDLLKRQEVRLITLTGFGGIGKTTLAVHIARSAPTLFPDGYAFVPLASVGEPEVVARHIAQTLELTEAQDVSPIDTVIDHLAEREMLLVLDNFEHVLDSRALVNQIRDSCPRIVILVTSRQRLRLSGEHVITLPPMSLPAPESQNTAAGAGASDAVQLFIERARAARYTFALTDANAADISAICRTVDGIPLAIELAASRMRSLSTRDLLAFLTPGFQIATGGPEDSDARHHTMSATIAWSYGLLPEAHRRLFRTLCVFAGGFTINAARALSTDGTGETLSDADSLAFVAALDNLVESHLVEFTERPEGGGRYAMLESIREFGLQQLIVSGEETAARDRHAAYFHQLAINSIRGYQAGKIGEWNPLLEPEQNNIRQAIRWTIDHDAPGGRSGLDFVTSIWHFWSTRAYWVEAIEWLRAVIAAANEVVSIDLAKAWLYLGNSLFDNQRAARAAYEEALRLFQELNDDIGVTISIAALSAICELIGEYDEGKALAADALRRMHAAPGDNHRGIGLISIFLADLEMNSGHPTDARPHLENALEIWRSSGNEREVTTTIARLGRLERLIGHHQDAVAHLRSAVAVSQQQGHQNAEYRDLAELGLALLAAGDIDEALIAFRRAVAIARELGVRDGSVARALEGTALAFQLTKRGAQAAELYGAAEHLREQSGTPLPQVERKAHRRDLASLRKSLGSGSFTTHSTIGASRPIAYAFDLVESLPAADSGVPVRESSAPAGVFAPLSPREREALCELALGKSDREIAAALGVTTNTARTLVQRIRDKLGAANRHEASLIAIRSGWCPGGPISQEH